MPVDMDGLWPAVSWTSEQRISACLCPDPDPDRLQVYFRPFPLSDAVRSVILQDCSGLGYVSENRRSIAVRSGWISCAGTGIQNCPGSSAPASRTPRLLIHAFHRSGTQRLDSMVED